MYSVPTWRKNALNRILLDITENIEEKELVMILVFTTILMILSFVAHSRVATVMISSRYGDMDIPIVYYGYPFEMLGYLNPVGMVQWAALNSLGQSYLSVQWGGLSLNLILFFSLSFVVVYALKKISLRSGAYRSYVT